MHFLFLYIFALFKLIIMKRLSFFLCTLLTIYVFGGVLPAHGIGYNKTMTEVIEGKSYVRLELEVGRSCGYILKFWTLGHRDFDNYYAKYPVYINDEYVGMLDIQKANWHFAGIDGISTVYMNKGVNRISIVGELPNVPNIEFIKAIPSDEVFYDGGILEYSNIVLNDDFKLDVRQKIVVDYDEIRADEDSTLYDYSYSIRQPIDYTFFTDLYYKVGDEVFIEGYPIDDCPYVLELFHAKKPENNSWISMSNKNGQACIQVNIKEAGRYYFRARTTKNDVHGFCSININGAIYDSIPISCCNIPCDIEADKKYNIFTCNSVNSDPVIIVLDEDYNILAFDDDYGGDYEVDGTFNWGNDARIRKEFKEKPKYISVFSYSSYNKSGMTDIYIGCKDADSYLTYYFKNLNVHDCMEAAPATIRYNCMAWAMGLWDEWYWPSSEILDSKNEEEQTLYFCDELHDYGYVQCDEESAMIDLWALFDEKGKFKKYTHMSVRNVSAKDKFLHGYDWESKLGSSERIFHPRYSLEGNIYGKVVMHFKPQSNIRNKSMYEKIADGEIINDEVEFEQYYIDVIESRISLLDNSIREAFFEKYISWRNHVLTLPYSDMREFTYNDQYKKFYDFCIRYPEVKYLIYSLVEDDESLSMQVVEDLIKPQYIDVFNTVQNNLSLSDSEYSIPVHRNNFTKIKYFVKELIRLDTGMLRSKSSPLHNLSENKIDKFDVEVNGYNVYISIDIVKDSKTELLIYSLDGLLIKKFVDNVKLLKGHYRYSESFESGGRYLVVLKSGGHTEVKKIMIN